MDAHDRIAILLCTYNGQKYLHKQLDSIISQSHKNWVIVASDDCSSDDTIAILKDYQEKLGANKLTITKGPRKGFAENFLSLIKDTNVKADYYAFCDQDDIWNSDKLERGLRSLQSKVNIPALYCSRTELIDEMDNRIGFSYLFNKPAALKNALLQSIAGGNTMLINDSARALLVETPDSIPIPSHDWWIYQCICACGGYVFYDQNPTVKYRQHSGNIVGANRFITARFLRLKLLFTGSLKKSIDSNIKLLQEMNGKLTENSAFIISEFDSIRNACIVNRLRGIYKLGLYRQKKIESIIFYLALLLKKV
ncbi:hypothetical protein BBB57_23150 [Kosakonia sacchari]|uniref:glycosyltransferase family 2 protein n=1 Tax=Kosakonia sacchari TaxID=1158459 RepID=UPI0008073E3F|nr:glycosyltransferase family 2 protein [Kosakonia sacchari]ANR80889.1 hypothetical protein BBB57_23150 [Kosakonia sacchari]